MLEANKLTSFQVRVSISGLDNPFQLLSTTISLTHGYICQQKGTEAGEQSFFLMTIVNRNDHNLAPSHFITNHKHYFRRTDHQLGCIYRNLCCGQRRNFQMRVLSLPNSRKIPEQCSALLAMGRNTEYLIFQDKQWSGLCSEEPDWL